MLLISTKALIFVGRYISMFALILFLQLFVCVYSKETCLRLSNCKCKHSKGVVDLSALHGQSFSDTLKQHNESLEFTFFPCNQTKDLGPGCMMTDNNAVCMKNGTEYVSYGVTSGVEFTVPYKDDYSIILAKFKPLTGKDQKSEVNLKCSNDKTITHLKVYQVQNNNVQLELSSREACFTPPDIPPLRVRDPWGSCYLLVNVISLIIVTVSGVLVITTCLRYRKGIRGVELINHTDNCFSGFRLGRDGVRTLFSCFPYCRRKIGVDFRDGYSTVHETQSNC